MSSGKFAPKKDRNFRLGSIPSEVEVQLTTGIGSAISTGAFYYGNAPMVEGQEVPILCFSYHE